MVLLGLLAGALIRRTVGAVAVTAGGWMATQLLLDTGLPAGCRMAGGTTSGPSNSVPPGCWSDWARWRWSAR